MPHYFFDCADGERDVDHDGVAYDNDAAACTAAIRYAGDLISDNPVLVTHEGQFLVTVRRDDGTEVTKLFIRLRDGDRAGGEVPPSAF